MSRTPGRYRRAVAVIAAALTTTGLFIAVGQPAAAAPPPNPSNTKINSAQAQKNALAAEVGRLAGQEAQMQTQLEQVGAQLELAEQKVAYALSKLQLAQAAATKARKTVNAAQNQVTQAQRQFVGYMQASYMSGGVDGTTSLLTADDPNILLQQGTLRAYESSHRLSAIGNLQRSTVARSNADAAARKAVKVQTEATTAAQTAKVHAASAYTAAQEQQQQLKASMATSKTQLQAAQVKLATLNHQRAQFLAYQKRQAQLAAERLRQQQLAQQRADARARADALAASHRDGNGGGGNGGGSGGGGGSYVAPGPRGSWTPAAGRRAVERAEHWLGTPYAWAGGNANGPTYGVCVSGPASNACHIIGFDCSGLMMYAWAQYPFAHYAATQYLQGSVHPNTSSLMPGDLLFWSSNGTVAGIHHVAMYIGGGDVVEAPHSGSYVKITPLSSKGWGYFGATRPLT